MPAPSPPCRRLAGLAIAVEQRGGTARLGVRALIDEQELAAGVIRQKPSLSHPVVGHMVTFHRWNNVVLRCILLKDVIVF